MEFDEIVVKESPGLCRCCLSEGCYKDLGTEYTWMHETEVYADMLLECFDISITQHNEGPNGASRLICEVCITRLRDACNFKKQVLESEKKFIDMLGRGEFKPKVLIYQTQMKAEHHEEIPQEVEYLEEDVDFDDGEVLNVTEAEQSTTETVTAETLTLKRKMKTKKAKVGRPKKQLDLEEKPKSSKTVVKGEKPTSKIDEKSLTTTMRNRFMKKNAITILENSTVTPFKWQLKDYLCFHCHFPFKEIEVLKEHTREKHKTSNVRSAVSCLKMDDKVKIDITDAVCKLCEDDFDNLEAFINHLSAVHDVKLNDKVGYGVVPYRVGNDLKCGVCDEEFKYFISLNQHMNKHFGTYVCEQCGKAYLSYDRLRAHYLMHGARFKCRYCEEAFESLVKRKLHEAASHDQSKPIQCIYCSETFKNYNERKKHHSLIHKLDVVVFNCPVCGKEFSCRSRMESHLREVHVRERNIPCTMCESKFFSKGHLHKHMKRHIGLRVHQCKICKKSYVRKQTLSDHMKVHSNDKKCSSF